MERPDHCNEVYDRPVHESEVDNSVYNEVYERPFYEKEVTKESV